MTILGIPGSLRTGSKNHAILEAAQRLAPDLGWQQFPSLDALPHFSPDRDRAPVPAAVAALRSEIREAQGLVICSPEYIHGVPGALKNALDWLASSGELADKPLLLWSVSPSGGQYAHGQLLEVLRVLTARVLPEACLQIVSAAQSFGPDGQVQAPALLEQLAASLERLRQAIQATG